MYISILKIQKYPTLKSLLTLIRHFLDVINWGDVLLDLWKFSILEKTGRYTTQYHNINYYVSYQNTFSEKQYQ